MVCCSPVSNMLGWKSGKLPRPEGLSACMNLLGFGTQKKIVVVEHVARMVKSAIVSYIPLCVGEIFPLFIAQSSSITKFVKRLTK